MFCIQFHEPNVNVHILLHYNKYFNKVQLIRSNISILLISINIQFYVENLPLYICALCL